jgi:hypothetical protein
MAGLILPCECLTVRLPASITTTGLFAAGVSASGKTKARDPRARTKRKGPGSNARAKSIHLAEPLSASGLAPRPAWWLRLTAVPTRLFRGLSSRRQIAPKGYRLQAIGARLERGRDRMTSKSFHTMALAAALLVGCPLVASPRAQDAMRSEAAGHGRTYPSGLEIAFEWRYSCPGGKACSFNCPGAGGASNVTKLAIRLGSIPLTGTQRAFGTFYEFESREIPRGNGFALTTGISTLSCQVQGMDVEYSGPTDTNIPQRLSRPDNPS